MSEQVAWISVLSFQTVVVRILHFSGLVHRPTFRASVVKAVVVCCILDQESAINAMSSTSYAVKSVQSKYSLLYPSLLELGSGEVMWVNNLPKVATSRIVARPGCEPRTSRTECQRVNHHYATEPRHCNKYGIDEHHWSVIDNTVCRRACAWRDKHITWIVLSEWPIHCEYSSSLVYSHFAV